MAMAVGRGVDVRIAPAPKSQAKVWSPIPLIGMVGFTFAIIGAWRWYQQVEGFKSGLDATDPAFAEKWMPLFFLNLALAGISQMAIPLYFWFTRDKNLTRVAPAEELRRYFVLFAILITMTMTQFIAIIFGSVYA